MSKTSCIFTAGDGSITLEQFEVLAKDGVLLHGTLQQYSEAFQAVDSDHDGELPAAFRVVRSAATDSAGVSCQRVQVSSFGWHVAR